jgi:hypothetical protein
MNSIRATLASLPASSVIFVGVLAACALACACIGIYVGIRSAVEVWGIKRARRLRRQARRAKRAALKQALK